LRGASTRLRTLALRRDRPGSRGKVLISDGRSAATKEQIGGYRLIDCKDLDEAIEVRFSDTRHADRNYRGTAHLRVGARAPIET
jgi:hypothetical protein